MEVKINGVQYPVACNMGAVDGIMEDSDGLSLEEIFTKVVSITKGGIVSRKELNEANRLGMICVYHCIKNACELNNTLVPWPSYKNFAAHLKPSVNHQTQMGTCMGLFIEAFVSMNVEEEPKKETVETQSP
jgi:hypothetical protein